MGEKIAEMKQVKIKNKNKMESKQEQEQQKHRQRKRNGQSIKPALNPNIAAISVFILFIYKIRNKENIILVYTSE